MLSLAREAKSQGFQTHEESRAADCFAEPRAAGCADPLARNDGASLVIYRLNSAMPNSVHIQSKL
jgi:hypothetical protein